MTEATVNTAILSDDIRADAEQFGGEFARETRSTAQRLRAMLDLVDGMNYDEFMAVRAAFIKGAQTEGWKAADDLWDRTIKALVNELGFERPKSEKPKAQKMSAAREAARKAATEYIEEQGFESSTEIMAAIASAPKKIRKDLMTLAGQKEKEEAKTTREKNTEEAKGIIKTLRNVEHDTLKAIDTIAAWDSATVEWIANNQAKILAMMNA